MKLKYIVAALGLVATAASQAAITLPQPDGTGEMALVVYDSNASYTLDLGITYNAFLAGANASMSSLATLNSANWNTFVANEGANSADWQYAVFGARTNHGAPNSSLLSTINADSQATGVIGTYTSADVEGAVGQLPAYLNAVNATGTHKTTANGDSYNVAGTPAYFLDKSTDTYNGSFFESGSAVGTAMAVDLVTRNAAPSSDPTEQYLAGMLNLQSNNGTYSLAYTVSAVPEAPGAAMMIAGMGLMGLFVKRRRNRA